MKTFIIVFVSLVTFSCASTKRQSNTVTVPAGRTVMEYFPVSERYRYPEFVNGKVVFLSGAYTETRLNYNILMGEMEFIKSSDTLAVSNPAGVLYIVAGEDTFFYNNGYLEVIADAGNLMVASKRYVKLKETQAKDSYGVSSAGSARESYNVLPNDVNFYRLRSNTDIVLEKVEEFYITDNTGKFIPLRKSSVPKLYPEKEEEIKNYLKANPVDFSSRQDVLKFTSYLRNL